MGVLFFVNKSLVWYNLSLDKFNFFNGWRIFMNKNV